MLALQGYGSSDDNSDHDNEANNSEEKNEVKNDNSSSNNEFILPIGESVTSLSLQICAAPEVVPTVSQFI